MLKLKVHEIGKGFHPQEVLVEVNGIEGKKKLLVDKRTLQAGTLNVGNAISSANDKLLVELPRETTLGEWRIWVPTGEVQQAHDTHG